MTSSGKYSKQTVQKLYDENLKYVNSLDQSHLLIKSIWEKARRNFKLPVYTYPLTLLKNGTDLAVINSIYKILINLQIDISDPYCSSSELSLIVGFMSSDLLGVDLKPLRQLVDKIEINSSQTKSTPNNLDIKEFVFYNDQIKIYRQLQKVRNMEKMAILSSKRYYTIAKSCLKINDTILKKLIRAKLKIIWNDLKIDTRSPATIFFRNLKTFAGDIDFIYWGPKREECIVEIAKYLISLGYAVDLFSCSLIDSIIKNKYGHTNSFLGSYIHMYFFMGVVIELNSDTFQKHYQEDILPSFDKRFVWESTHYTLVQEIELMKTVYSKKSINYPGFKDLPLRCLTRVLMGLSLKYNIRFTLNYEDFIKSIVSKITHIEANKFIQLFYYINEIRNIYQVVTQRRRELINYTVLKKINKIIVKQGDDTIEDAMRKSARFLSNINQKYFGEPKNKVLTYDESKIEASDIYNQSIKKQNEIYKVLLSTKNSS